jgi:hypothetical protein
MLQGKHHRNLPALRRVRVRNDDIIFPQSGGAASGRRGSGRTISTLGASLRRHLLVYKPA